MHLAGILFAFTVLVLLTSPSSLADSLYYAEDVLRHADGRKSQFWEFAHIWWRPLGELGRSLTGSLFQQWFGDTPIQAVIRFYMVVNVVSGAGTLCFLFAVLRRLVSLRVATMVGLALAGTHSLLNFSQAASSYTPALLLLSAAIYAAFRGMETTRYALGWVAACGALLGLSAGFWFPFSLVGLGLLALCLNTDKNRLPRTLVLLSSVGLVYLSSLGLAAWMSGVGSGAEFLAWYRSSNHGSAQSLNPVRFALGWTRGFFALGDDNILMKQIFFRDPYNQPDKLRFGSLLALRAGLCFGATLIVLWRVAAGIKRRDLAIAFWASLGPLLFFALFILEPSSTERYMPGLPFLFLALALVLEKDWNLALVRWPLVIFLAAMPLLNGFEMTFGNQQLYSNTIQRQKDLEASLKSRNALVLGLTIRDWFLFYPHLIPLDERIGRRSYETNRIVELSSAHTPQWRQEFASQVLAAWRDGREVWVSRRGLAARPAADWLWVEGDDPRVKWADFAPFFSSFTLGPATGEDGFSLLPDNTENRSRCQSLVNSGH
jgi:hypothetical protein